MTYASASQKLDGRNAPSPGGKPSSDAAYDDEEYVDDRTIDSHIKRLRIKFRASDIEFDMVETLYGIGYRFKEV